MTPARVAPADPVPPTGGGGPQDSSGAFGADVEARIDAALAEVNLSGARVGYLLSGVLMPAGVTLDWVTHPDLVGRFFWIRIVAGLSAFLLYAVAQLPMSRRHPVLLGSGPPLICALGIEGMVVVMGDFTSPYYAGLNLCILAVGVLYTWRWWQAALVSGIIVVAWLVPAVPAALAGTLDGRTFFNNFYFLALTGVIAVAAAANRHRAARREIAAQVKLELASTELVSALDALRELDRMKNEFFTNVSHELRTPLTMILAPIESMRAGEFGALSKAQQEPVESVWKNGIRLLKLINDLLDLARSSEKFLYLQVVQTSLRETLATVVEYARPLAARKSITLELRVEEEPAELHCDPEKMERVIVNLLSNALKFTEVGGRVEVTLGRRGSEAFVAVRDTGVGIPADKISSIFERFTQADASVTRRYGGTGIGLAFAHSIVSLHGGRMEVESVVDRGSTFTVLLPLGIGHLDPKLVDRRKRREPGPDDHGRRRDDQGPREWAARLSDLEEYRFQNLDDATDRRRVRRGAPRPAAARVLVVEDSLDVAEFLQMHLAREYTVFVASDGKEGLALAREKRPDAIVTDFMMPEMDGLTMLRELRADDRTAEIPVVMLTAKAQLDDRLAARGVGADAYLAKPFSPQELRAVLAQQLARRGRQVRSMLRANTQSLEVVSAGLSHEINNPLNYIRTAADVLAAGLAELAADATSVQGEAGARARALDERLRRMCDSIGVGVRKIENVVEIMRRYAQEGYAHVAEPVDLDAALRDVVALTRPRGAKQVHVELATGAPSARVVAIPEELSQALSNIVQNAVDAVGEGGRVTVRSSLEGGGALVEIEDDGPGIAPEARERLFTPFYTTKAPGEGLGLGLSIAQRVVSDARGHIEVQSVPGTGSTFRVHLPLVAAVESPVRGVAGAAE